MGKQWLIDLIAEYTIATGPSKPDRPPAPDKIQRLDRLFVHESPAVMQLAVNDYMRGGGRFFPRVGDLTLYVTAAAAIFGRLIRPDLLSENDRVRVDEALYSVEVSAGTIDQPASSAADVEARRQLAELGKCPTCGAQLFSGRSCAYCKTGRFIDTIVETAVFEL